MDVQVRRAGTKDAAIVALLGQITFAETFGGLFRQHPGDLRAYLETTFSVAKIERSLGNPANVYWLALRDRLPIGYAKLKLASALPGGPRSGVAQLQKIYILHAFLGCAIGRTLLEDVMVAAQGTTVWLDVLRENTRAIGFYKHHGFERIGEDTYTIGAQSFQFDLMERTVP